MAQLQWTKLVGQQRIRETLSAAFAKDALGHAYLFSGSVGLGKFQCALELATGLLCDSDPAPCYSCESCRQLLHYAHPDFHMIFPVHMPKEMKSSDGSLNEKGWDQIAGRCREKIADPYMSFDWPGIPSVPVEWIREVNHAIGRGAIKGKRNVAIISDVDCLRKESANAMLKTLEEPPSGTVILLLTERIHAVLPTIVSRCQVLRFGAIDAISIADALKKRAGGEGDAAHVRRALDSCGGSLGAAIRMLEQPIDQHIEQALSLWGLCFEKDWLSIAAAVENLAQESLEGGRNYRACEKMFEYVGAIARDNWLMSIPGARKYIREEFLAPALSEWTIAPEKVEKILSVCQDAVSSAKARGNITMILVTFIIKAMEIIRG